MKQWPYVLSAIGILACLAGFAEAASLKVSPGGFIVHDVEPGRLYDIYDETGLRLTIYNDDNVSRTWSLSIHRPSERGRWETGYGEIPDPKWCRFRENEVTVPAGSVGHAYLLLQVPAEEKYFNQRWIATSSVKGKVEGGPVALAVDIRVLIETKSKKLPAVRPDGVLAFAPSVVEFEGVVPGEVRNAEVVLYNNDDRAHTYTVSSLFKDAKINQNTYLTGTYAVLPEPAWLRYDPLVKIEAAGSAHLNLELTLPQNDDHLGQKWEDCLLIEPDQGLPQFVRVRVAVPEAAGDGAP